MERQELMKVIQRYLGMTPNDLGCSHWSQMQQKMADEIMRIEMSEKESKINYPAGHPMKKSK